MPNPHIMQKAHKQAGTHKGDRAIRGHGKIGRGGAGLKLKSDAESMSQKHTGGKGRGKKAY